MDLLRLNELQVALGKALLPVLYCMSEGMSDPVELAIRLITNYYRLQNYNSRDSVVKVMGLCLIPMSGNWHHEVHQPKLFQCFRTKFCICGQVCAVEQKKV